MIICGKNSVLDAIENNLPLINVYIAKHIRVSFNQKINVKFVTKEFLNKLTKENHQGYVAEIRDVNYYGIEEILREKPNKILILDHIQDTHNFGAIMRTANAVGIKHIMIPKERQIKINAGVMKVSSGGFINMKIISVSSLQSAVQQLKKNDFWIYSSAISDNSTDISEASWNYPAALVVGSEKSGVSKPILKLSDQVLHIPMKGTVQSLNVSVAAGILMFSMKD